MTNLFDPIQLGAIRAPNRIIMAPLTRGRSTHGHVPTDMMSTYYAQRAGAGLIISEGVGISQQGLGWPFAPGIWSDAQTEAWKPVTDAVHQAGGRIVAQIWHMGRLVHSSFNDGRPGVSASATIAPDLAHTYQGRVPYEEAHPLTIDEIQAILADYHRAAINAKQAGFDGVQLHGANGYLIDQFLRNGTNRREDDYGGSVENRTRLLREVTQTLIDVWGADRVGVRLSPNGDSQGTNDSNPASIFGAAASVLDALGIAFLELREPGPDGTFGATDVPRQSPAIRGLFKGPLILNSDYELADGQAMVDAGLADAISYGRPFITNPDLVDRFRTGAPRADSSFRSSYYTPGEAGYIDYPTAAVAIDAA